MYSIKYVTCAKKVKVMYFSKRGFIIFKKRLYRVFYRIASTVRMKQKTEQ